VGDAIASFPRQSSCVDLPPYDQQYMSIADPFRSIYDFGPERRTAADHCLCPRVPGADADLFTDDGTTYAYEKRGGSITKLHWDEAHEKLTHEGAAAWSGLDASIVDVIH